jgi:hypothetical protein
MKTCLSLFVMAVALLSAPLSFAQARIEQSARSFIDPSLELKIMNLVPICHPNAPIESDGSALKCGRIVTASECPPNHASVGLTGQTINCRPLAMVPPTPAPTSPPAVIPPAPTGPVCRMGPGRNAEDNYRACLAAQQPSAPSGGGGGGGGWTSRGGSNTCDGPGCR